MKCYRFRDNLARVSIGQAEVCETRILLAAADLDPSFDNDGKVFLEATDNRDDEIAGNSDSSRRENNHRGR